MAARSICVLGGSGFIGTQLCAALAREGWRITVPTRNPARAQHLSVIPSLRLIGADVRDPRQLAILCDRQQAVINLVGILNEKGRDGSGFARVHTDLARKLVDACRSQRVGRLLQMSALNADADRGASHYLKSKGAAERIIREESGPDLRWTIFQPSVIFGPGDDFVNRFAGLLRMIPGGLPLARPGARFAPVWVEDVVAAFLRALVDDATAGESYQLCGPDRFTLREIVCLVRDELGLRRAIAGLPDWSSRLQAAICDFVPGKPFSSDNYRSLTVDSVCTVNGLARLGIHPQSLTAILPRYLGHQGVAGRNSCYRQSASR
ncbi:MAG: complex I NDUFA9 subunit family protein [Gammaproteobacteria bacterium]|nr:complex I NDUFA9 subunit family protein [Gammaproteobacteria bacterium]